tara:strand:+ start:7662 stop:8096 length:435 start_codon:yes stop_codon:yes gene_type:complete
MSEPVLFYERRFYCFSNFSSFQVVIWGEVWMTSEHAYQAQKFITRKDIQAKIQDARSAHDAKVIAREHAFFTHSGWEKEKLEVMEDICRAKLEQHEFIQKRLRETGDGEIIEDSPKDSFWGWGPNQTGHNYLGKIWMKLRDEME